MKSIYVSTPGSNQRRALIAYIKGKLTFKSPAYVLIETGGIGYQVHISLNTWSAIQSEDEIRLFTHLHIKEDAHTLYGFAGEHERQLFIQMISVSGIGPNTARMVLSTLQPEAFEQAVIGEDEMAIRQIKGIGPKSAKRLILELKDKIGKGTAPLAGIAVNSHNTISQEALSALTTLGFSRAASEKAIGKVRHEESGSNTVEELIRLALRHM